MAERLADKIDELAQPNRPQQEEPQIQADPALRRPRLLRNTPAALVALIAVVAAAATALAKFWALGLPALSDRLGFLSDGLALRVVFAVVAGVFVGGLVAWAFRPARTLRGSGPQPVRRLAPTHCARSVVRLGDGGRADRTRAQRPAHPGDQW